MKSQTLSILGAALCVSLATTGCKKDGDTDEDTSVDTVTDTAADTTVDTTADTVEDVPADTAGEPDAVLDVEEDTPADVATDVDTDVATDLVEDADVVEDAAADDGGVAAYSHTIAIDGTNDFVTTDERLDTSSSGYWAWAAWDADYLYLAMQGADVSSGSAQRWVLVYLGGSAGTTTGHVYNTQTPGLPFPARWHVAWRCSNDQTDAFEYTGGAWTGAGWDFTGDVYQSGNFVEMRIPLADIGSPSTLDVVMYMINDTSSAEWSFAAVPSSAFTDGYDPDPAHHFTFDLAGATVPADHGPI